MEIVLTIIGTLAVIGVICWIVIARDKAKAKKNNPFNMFEQAIKFNKNITEPEYIRHQQINVFGCIVGTLIMIGIYGSMPGILMLISYLLDINLLIGLAVGLVFDIFVFFHFQKRFKELGW
jgi:hypothetical protein